MFIQQRRNCYFFSFRSVPVSSIEMVMCLSQLSIEVKMALWSIAIKFHAYFFFHHTLRTLSSLDSFFHLLNYNRFRNSLCDYLRFEFYREKIKSTKRLCLYVPWLLYHLIQIDNLRMNITVPKLIVFLMSVNSKLWIIKFAANFLM